MDKSCEFSSNQLRVVASAPCRIDMGGTLDIATFYYPLRSFRPVTFNIALDLRTTVTVSSHDPGWVKISSRGFQPARFPKGAAPYDHPLGLMFAVVDYFGGDGLHISIKSSSPPRSALGGSSAAAAALVAALFRLNEERDRGTPPEKIALLTHGLEGAVAGVPCGIQDHLAAIYGGVNAWYWLGSERQPGFEKKRIVAPKNFQEFRSHLLVAYGGSTHTSADVNGRWVREFISGSNRLIWRDIVHCTHAFIEAVSRGDYQAAASHMNHETELRRKMTPDVLEETGRLLVEAAIKHNCGARFTGAGGGGCLWALGAGREIDRLRPVWEDLLSGSDEAALLDCGIDAKGLEVETASV
jgi:D-glycero-alpha-D-manno-heptose-7-phosphate kinase